MNIYYILYILYIFIILIILSYFVFVHKNKKVLRFIPEPEVLSYLSESGAILIDVRSSYERKQGNPPQSLHLPIDRLVFDLERLIPEKTQPIIFCCKRAIRSEGAVVIARRLGYSNVSYTGNCEFI